MRYDRQMRIAGWGEEGQHKLRRASVAIVGAGGLGCPIAIYLGVAGVGRLKIIDDDTVEVTNLNRQILHWDKDIGKNKALSASRKIAKMNPEVEVTPVTEHLTEHNVEDLLCGVDAIVDALDRFSTRMLLNRFAVVHRMPLFHGAVWGFEGRATTIIPGETACLRCFYRGEPPQETFPVVGVAPALIGVVQATEVIKYFTGIGSLLLNRYLIYDGASMSFYQVKLRRDPQCPVCSKTVAG